MYEGRQTETVEPGGELPKSAISFLAPGTRMGERYEIRGTLGVGGSSVVYHAYDRDLRRDVALKIVRTDRISDATLKRFRREVAVARDAQHPNLLRIFDIGQFGDSIFLDMEYVSGGTLRSMMAAGPMAIDRIIDIAAQLLRGLDALHSLGIVHRDVKPANLLLTEEGVVKLADFGLARRLEGDETRATHTDAVVGTFEYLSPEQALGKELDARSDLYSAGVLLFEMLTGKVPLQGLSSLGTVVAHLSEEAPDVRKLRRDVPRWLAALIGRLLRKSPEERYPTSAAVLHDLQRRRARRPVRIRRASVAAAAAIVILAGLGFGFLNEAQGRRFDGIAKYGSTGLQALDRRGRVLWRHDYLTPGLRSTIARIDSSGKPYVVGIAISYEDLDPARNHTVSVYDAQSGSLVRAFSIPNGSGHFPQFSDRFVSTRISAVDLDGNGIDEIVISMHHYLYWPSYSIYHDPATAETGVVLIASGHHRLIGTADVDQDGRKDLLFAGPNNKMGWHLGVAAVSVIRLTQGGEGYVEASSPDADYASNSDLNLLWYALLPRWYGASQTGPSWNSAEERVEIRYPDGVLYLGLDGHLVEDVSRLPPVERRLKRLEAYRELREGLRLTSMDRPDEALPHIISAQRLAAEVNDSILQQWIARVHARTLIYAGQDSEAETIFTRLVGDSRVGSDAAWDAALAFHLTGRLERAIVWYTKGLGSGASSSAGRLKYEYLEGLVLALGEMDRWQEGRNAISRFVAAYPSVSHSAPHYEAYIEWRTSGSVSSLPPIDGNHDLIRYWNLEFRNSAGEAPDSLLAAIENELTHVSGSNALLLSLKAEVLRRAGRSTEALPAIRAALDDSLISRNNDRAVRAHFDLIQSRYDRIVSETRAKAQSRGAATYP